MENKYIDQQVKQVECCESASLTSQMNRWDVKGAAVAAAVFSSPVSVKGRNNRNAED